MTKIKYGIKVLKDYLPITFTFIIFFTLIFLASFALAGCGDDDDESYLDPSIEESESWTEIAKGLYRRCDNGDSIYLYVRGGVEVIVNDPNCEESDK